MTPGVTRVVDAPLPFHQDDVRILAALEHQPLCGAGDEVRHYRVHRDAPAFNHDPRLPGSNETGPDRRRSTLFVS